MNQNGWGIREVMMFVCALSLALLVTMVMYNRTFNQLFGGGSSNESYSSLEGELKDAGRTYTDNFYYKVLESGDDDYVTVDELIDKDIIKPLKDPNNGRISCRGYVHFYKKEGVTTYDSYLKCGDAYKTKGYDSSHD